ncbi:MAG: patatin-like phospholipase family protein [Bacilli bacterium]|nr:patatin-like phospholipase family protein [Bacilli bacterium]
MKALVLSGGGSKGSYQVGVWKALRELNIKFDIVTGTSVGALNGAMIVQNDYRKAVSIWKKINLKVLFGEDAIESTNNFEIYKMYSKHFLKYGGMNVRDLEKLIRKSLNLRRFYNSKINYGLTAYNLTSKEAIELQKKDIERLQLDDYLMASASCFPAFKKKDIEGEKHIDGGYHDNLPINLALDMGADEIIAVDLNAPGLKKSPKKKAKITYIKPRNKLTNFLNFYEKGTESNMKFGYNDTMKTFGKFEGNKYTFRKNQLEKNRLLYQETYLHVLNKILKYKKVIKSFEELINTNITIEDETKDEIFEKLMLKIMESTAKSFKLDETRVYTHHSFNKLLQIELKKYLKDEIETNEPCKKKEIELYKLIKEAEYQELRKQALLNPIDTLKAIYIYTICEA